MKGYIMDKDKFSLIAESLRQYRRAELKDYERDLGNQPAIDLLYVDPLPSDVILKNILSSNTIFLLGRKGTGKSTIFAKAQSIIRKESKDISIYIDVKSIYDLVNTYEVPVQKVKDVSEEILQAHLVRKTFLGSVISDLIKELKDSCDRLTLMQKLKGKKRELKETMFKLEELGGEVKVGRLSASEIPILQVISKKNRDQIKQTEHSEKSLDFTTKISPTSANLGLDAKLSGFDELLTDNEMYESYSDAVLRSFPFSEILTQIKGLLNEIGMNKLIIFFDDFSEIHFLNQRLFVDIVLAPLNNSSDERVKLKIAGYPGRVYFGKIDPGKVDTIYLDFSRLYKDKDLQITEKRAIEYTKRLLTRRFDAFHTDIKDYFDPKTELEDYMKLIFQCTFNVPRIMGYILNYCYRDRISQNSLITPAAIRLASQKYYEDVLIQYFDKFNRFALEPFDRKLDRHIQQELLKTLINEIKDVRRKIITKEIGGKYFNGITNPPTSHFYIGCDLEPILSSLEFNFLLTKYHELRDKDGNDIAIYALNYGLCESEKIPWGYPKGKRDDRSYLVQRCFDFNRVLHEFLAKKQTIRCSECGASFSIDKKDSFVMFGWQCPECKTGKCDIVNLSDDYKREIEQLDKDLMLEKTDLEILQILNSEGEPMRANEISELIDESYQLVGKRTSKLRDSGYVEKKHMNGAVVNIITQTAKSIYF